MILPRNSEWLSLFYHRIVEGSKGCWLWTGSTIKKGYGTVRPKPRQQPVLAHRLSWSLINGEIPAGLLVLHDCDIPACINPDHLWLGTNQDNMDDMFAKGRKVVCKGQDRPNAILSDFQVLEIRKKYATGDYTQQMLALEYHVSRQVIYCVVNRKRWKHI